MANLTELIELSKGGSGTEGRDLKSRGKTTQKAPLNKPTTRTDELYRNYAHVLEKLAKEQELAAPSFSPTLISNQSSDKRAIPVFELLHMDAMLRNEKLLETQERRDKELRALSAATTTPRKERRRGGGSWSGRRASEGGEREIDRFQVLWEDSKALQMKRTADAMKVPRECTYTPRLVAKGLDELRMEKMQYQQERRHSSPCALPASSSSSSSSPSSPTPSARRGDCFTRLFSASWAVAAARKAREERRQQELLKDCTFVPNLARPTTPYPSYSPNIPTRSSSDPSPADVPAVFERLNGQSKKLRARQKVYERERKEKELEGCTWKPQIFTTPRKAAPVSGSEGGGEWSNTSVEGGHDVDASTGGNEERKAVFNRLYSQAAELRMRQILYDNLQNPECTFRPILNSTGSRSQEWADTDTPAASSADTAINWVATSKSLSPRERATSTASTPMTPTASANNPAITHPAVTPVPLTITTKITATPAIEQNLQRLLSPKATSIERQEEEEQLRECTFSPTTNLSRARSRSQSPRRSRSPPPPDASGMLLEEGLEVAAYVGEGGECRESSSGEQRSAPHTPTGKAQQAQAVDSPWLQSFECF